MKKYKESDGELLMLLLNLQESTSPIKMSIGYVDGIVRNGIVLHEAAPAVINALVRNGYTCSLRGCGMLVYKL